MLHHRAVRIVALAACAAAASCSGYIGSPRGDGGTQPHVPGRDGDTARPPFAPAPANLHRLTVVQYRNSVADLMGEGVRVPTELEADTRLYGFSTIGASELTISPRAAELFEAAALDVAHQAFADDAHRRALVGCAPADASDPCVRTFLAAFGRRAFRRPLEPAEVDRYAGVVATVGASLRNVWAGLEYAVAGILQSPYFLFRVELGEPDPADPSRRRYSGYEMASRLSYFFWNSTPDDALLDAAGRGELATAAGVRAQAERLLASPRARAALRTYFVEYLNLDRLDELAKDPDTFPLFTPTLGASMRGEVVRVVDDLVFERDADFREILDTRTTFVNAELARLYNLPPPAGNAWARVSLPDDGPRAGLMGFAGILALYAHATVTSPTLRGRFIRQNLLCQEIPPPPPGVVTSLGEEDPDAGPRTLRQRLEERHLAVPTCAACHSLMDPLGFGLENFDAIGAYRTTELGLPVDSRSEVDGRAFRNARELGALLREQPGVGACLVRKAYRYATGHVDTEGEEAVIRDLTGRFEASGYRFRTLLLDLVASDGFRHAADPR